VDDVSIAFPSVGIQYFEKPKDPKSPITIANEEWARRRPLFEALVAKGANLKAAHLNGTTPLDALLRNDCWSLDAIDWFIAHGADILDRSGLAAAAPETRPELARRYLFPKLAKPETILIWKKGDPLEKPSVFPRDAQHESPPTLAELTTFQPQPKESTDAPVSGQIPRQIGGSNPGQSIPRGATLERTPLFAVINRKGADGRWVETAVVSLTKGEAAPKLEWGDAVFLSTRGRPDWEKVPTAEEAPK
jgi:hypothetical protein